MRAPFIRSLMIRPKVSLIHRFHCNAFFGYFIIDNAQFIEDLPHLQICTFVYHWHTNLFDIVASPPVVSFQFRHAVRSCHLEYQSDSSLSQISLWYV